MQQVDNLGIANMAFTYFNTDILVNGIADIKTLAGPCLTQIINQLSTTSYLKADVYTKTDTLALNNLTNYNTKTTTTSILINYYNKTETLNISTFSNYYTKTTANSLLSQKQDTLSSMGVNGIPIFMNPTQLSNIMGGINISAFRNFPDGEINSHAMRLLIAILQV